MGERRITFRGLCEDCGEETVVTEVFLRGSEKPINLCVPCGVGRYDELDRREGKTPKDFYQRANAGESNRWSNAEVGWSRGRKLQRN